MNRRFHRSSKRFAIVRGIPRFIAAIILLLILSISANAQGNRTISYGETVSAYFDGETSHDWSFTASAGEIVEITVRRIAGRFEPEISLIDPNGTVSQELNYYSLPLDGTYTLRISEANNQNSSSLILNEYSLGMNFLGRHRTNIEEGLEPLPSLESLPALFTGEGSLEAALGINIFGTAQISRPGANTYLLAGTRSLTLDNANPISRGITALAFSDAGLALQATTGAVFFTDQDILALETIGGITTIGLADGSSIRTDFYRIRSIQVLDGLLELTFDTEQKLIAQGQTFEFLRRGGTNGEGPNAEPVNTIRVDSTSLETDLQAWRTLAILGEDFRVYYDEMRYLGESSTYSLFFDENILLTDGETIMTIDPLGIAEIDMRGETVTIHTLDGRRVNRSRLPVYDISISNRVITIRLDDGSSSLSLPDGTLIESPSAIPVDNTALPNQSGFRPRNFNNLGARPFDYHPMPNFDFALLPVNRVNGNFFYQITDFSIESDALALEWTRYYNSMGQGWRHSYQYELDFSYLALGEIWLKLPDGSHHIFNRRESIFRSSSLLSWTIQQRQDARWEAYTTEGYSYDFDLAGRLSQINKGNHSLLFSPAPRGYLGSYASGFFVTDTYGRRIEVYQDEAGFIREVRDVLNRSIRYDYDGTNLVSVDYSHNNDTVRYSYTEGLLTGISDPNSPYHHELHMDYDVQGRITNFQKNTQDDTIAQRNYIYSAGRTTEIEYVNSTQRQHVFSYDESFRLTRYDTPRPDWFYRWTYSNSTGRLSEFAQPDRSILRYQYDEFGYLTTLTDPLFGSGTGSYNFHYISPDNRLRLLSAVDLPNDNDYLTLQYNSENRLIRYDNLDYTYDEMGRVQSIKRPDRTIVYTYDEFGYPSSINEADGARIINLRHDMLGRLLSETDGRGTLTSYLWSSTHNRLDSKIVGDWRYDYGYDERGNLTSYSFNGHAISYSYNDLNQRIASIEIIDTVPYTHHYLYDEAGNLLSHGFPGGSTEHFAYDALNMLTQYTDSNGLNTNYSVTLNTEGNRTTYRVAYPSGESVETTYDALGRVRQVLWQDRTGEESFNYTLTYNALGYLTSIDENHVPGGRNLSISYDARNNPVSATLNNIATTRYGYDESNRLVSETDPEGRVTGYSYDAMGNLTSITQPDGSILSYGYDENGNRISFTEAGGAQWFYSYDRYNRLTEIFDPANNLTSYEYDDIGNLRAIVNANGGRINLSYDEASRLIESTDLAGNTTNYLYNDRGNIRRIEQEGGLSSDFFYDSADNLIALTQAGGRETLFGRDNEGRVVSITNSLGHSSFFAYNTIGTIGRLTNTLGDETIFRWSASGRIVGYSSSSGANYAYGNDRIGRLTSMNDSGSNQAIALNTLIEYDDAGYITSIRFGTTGTINGNQALVHRYTYTANGQIATYLPPEGTNPYRFEYDVNGRLSRSSNPLGIITSYSYDVMGNISEIRRAVDSEYERVETYSYDALGNVTRYIAPDGLISEYEYNSANRLVGRTDTDTEGNSRHFAYSYDAYGRLSSSTDPNGSVTSYRYDLYGNLIVEERGEASTRYEYDEVNNLRRIVSPAGQSQLMSYNASGQRVRFTDATNNAWSYGYDDAGNLNQVTDPLGNTIAYRYDPTNRLINIIFANDALIELIYNNQGNLAELRLPNNQRIRTEFDRAGNLSSVEYASNQIISYEYDELGRLIRQINADGQEITYSYDPHGNLISRVSPETTQTRTYNSADQLSQIIEGNSNFRFGYDGFGNLTAFRSPDVTASYSYDAAGNLLSRDAGEFGSISYSYDEYYRPTSITMGEESTSIAYNENGWHTSLQRSNGVETRYVYDDNGRVRNILHLNAEGERLDGFAYEYDTVGNILRVTRIDNWAVLYSYDESQNLISERWLSDDNQVRYAVSYAYDANGNRSEQTTRIGQGNPERTLFIYNNQNQLIEEIRNAEFTIEDRLAFPLIGAFVIFVPAFWFFRRKPRFIPIALAIIPLGLPLFQVLDPPSTEYDYDRNGNLISIIDDEGANLSLSYDSLQRLVAVEGINKAGETVATSIRYDALGNITEIIEGDVRYSLIYDAFGLLAIESAGNRSLYFTALQEPSLIKSENGLVWPLHDALGIARSYTDSTGAVTGFGLTTSSFGEMIDPYQSENAVNGVQFISSDRIYLPQAGIYLREARAYEPRLGLELQRPLLPDYAFSDFDPLAGAFFGLQPNVPVVNPEAYMPNADAPDSPAFDSVHEAQAAETARLLMVADMAYSQLNRPNILSQFMGLSASVAMDSRYAERERFASALREVPMYAPLIEELPYLLNYAYEQP